MRFVDKLNWSKNVGQTCQTEFDSLLFKFDSKTQSLLDKFVATYVLYGDNNCIHYSQTNINLSAENVVKGFPSSKEITIPSYTFIIILVLLALSCAELHLPSTSALNSAMKINMGVIVTQLLPFIRFSPQPTETFFSLFFPSKRFCIKGDYIYFIYESDYCCYKFIILI